MTEPDPNDLGIGLVMLICITVLAFAFHAWIIFAVCAFVAVLVVLALT